MTDFATLRQRMVDNQIRTSAVTDHLIIGAFLSVPREIFVEAAEQPFAYADRELAMAATAPQRRMIEPVLLARLVQALPLTSQTNALVVGCGTGYSAAIVGRLAGTVIALEQDAGMAEIARARLAAVGATNAKVVTGKLSDGHAAGGPYGAILVEGAVERLPEALTGQLAPEGALATVEREERISRAMLYERVGAEVSRWPQFEAWATLLPGFERKRAFVF